MQLFWQKLGKACEVKSPHDFVMQSIEVSDYYPVSANISPTMHQCILIVYMEVLTTTKANTSEIRSSTNTLSSCISFICLEQIWWQLSPKLK